MGITVHAGHSFASEPCFRGRARGKVFMSAALAFGLAQAERAQRHLYDGLFVGRFKGWGLTPKPVLEPSPDDV